MKSFNSLPEGYKEFYKVDFQKNRKTALIINLLAVIIGVSMMLSMHFIIPLSGLWKTEPNSLLNKLITLLFLLILYVILHEAVHGIAMKLCGTKKIKFGFTGAYAFAGSDDYYPKKPYIFIALAPVVFWGIVLAILTVVVPEEWFWIIYIVQIANISGAAGDFFVTAKFSRFHGDILVKDNGVDMIVYSKN